MFVLNELKKSVKELELVSKQLDKLDDISDLDEFEIKAQKLVFNLQMQANQVAGELAPAIMKKRTEVQQNAAHNTAMRVKEIVAAARAKAGDSKPKVEDDGNNNRQHESNAGDSKPKSAKKAK